YLMLVLFIGMAISSTDQHGILTEHRRLDLYIADQRTELPDRIRDEQVPGSGDIASYDNHIRVMFPDKILKEPAEIGSKYLHGCFCMHIRFSFIRYGPCICRFYSRCFFIRPDDPPG